MSLELSIQWNCSIMDNLDWGKHTSCRGFHHLGSSSVTLHEHYTCKLSMGYLTTYCSNQCIRNSCTPLKHGTWETDTCNVDHEVVQPAGPSFIRKRRWRERETFPFPAVGAYVRTWVQLAGLTTRVKHEWSTQVSVSHVPCLNGVQLTCIPRQ